MPDTPPTHQPCRWPADGHTPRSGYGAQLETWEECGRPTTGVYASPIMAIVLWRLPVCEPHQIQARRSGCALWGPDGLPLDGAEPAPAEDRDPNLGTGWQAFTEAFADAGRQIKADLDAKLLEAAETLRASVGPARRANRPINVASLRQVIDELRAYADAAPPAEPLAPETALWTARLLDMPVGHLLAEAERNGAERARDLGEIASECDEGTCPTAQAVVEALLEVGPWEEIDGDGSPSEIIADRVRDLGRWYDLGRRLVAYVDRMEAGPFDEDTAVALARTRLELGELFDEIADRKSEADETVDRLVVFCHGSDGQLRRVGDVDPVALRPDGEPLTIINPVAALLVETGGPTLAQPEHLTPVTSDRGFRRFPAVEAWHGGRRLRNRHLADLPAATGPHLWLTVKDFPSPNMPEGAPSLPMELSAHLPLVQAEHLRDQLTWLIDHHYQLDQPPAFPEVAANVDPDAFCDWASRAEWEEFADWCTARGLFVTPVPGVGGQLSEGDGFPGALHVELPGRPDRLTVRPMDRLTREGGAWRVDRRVPFALTTDEPAADVPTLAEQGWPFVTGPHPFQGADINKGYDLPCCKEAPDAEIHRNPLAPIVDAVDHHTPGRISGPGPVVWDGSAEHATHVIDWVLSRGGTASYDDREPVEPVIRVNVKRDGVPGVAILAPGQALAHEADGRWSVTSARLVVGVDPATDDLPNVAMAIIPADGGPPQILPAPTVEQTDAEPDPSICPGTGASTAAGAGRAVCPGCDVLVDVDADGFLEQHPASDPL